MRSLPLALFAVAALATTVAGCGAGSSSGSPGKSSPSPAVASPAASAPASKAAVASGSLTPDQLCALVPVKEADAAMHTSPAITEQESASFVHGEPECGYASADQSVIVNVTIFDPAKTRFDLTHAVVSAATLSPVTGLGKSAAYGSPELDVRYGQHGLVIESFGPTEVSKDQLVSLAKIELSRLS
jgi:hypothetical protein